MSNLSDLPIRLISPNSHTAYVNPYGFPMECEYEYDEGEKAVFWPTDNAHPGSPPNVQLLSCKVGGVDLMDMLSSDQIERIEDALLEQLEA